MTGPADDLNSLRQQIADTDRTLLELLRRRMELAAAVGEVKARSGAPVVVRDVEDRVLMRARQHAEACGVSPEVMEAIFQSIMRGSVERQHRVGVALRQARGGRVLVVGGAGAMGNWFRTFLAAVGHEVDVLDPAMAPLASASGRYSRADDVPDWQAYDFVIAATPLGNMPERLRELLRFRPRGPIVEIASIKDHLRPALDELRAAGLTVVALHPMFGPGKSPYEPLTFVVACLRSPEEELATLASLLAHPYSKLIPVPFPHHDRLMGWLLGLAHLTGMLFGAALTASGLDPAELQACASSTFARQAQTALSVLSEDPDLYLDIQRLNPHREEVYAATRRSLEELVRLVGSGERDGFRDLLVGSRRALQPEAG
jgi:chorismate mutase/prephenate dehydrogenase